MKIVITIIIAILVIGVAGFFFYEGRQESVYRECLNECKEQFENSRFLIGGDNPEYANPRCKLICIEKHK